MNPSGLDLDVQLRGFSRAIRGLNNLPLADATRAWLHASGMLVRSLAQIRAPRNLGALAGSIRERVDGSENPTFVDIGSNLHYAPYMEFGTGMVHDHPTWPRAPHIPYVGKNPNGQPVLGLLEWGRQKGGASLGYAAAKAIAKRGGIKPRRYLRGALEEAVPTIAREYSAMVGRLLRNLGEAPDA